jgi:hypothetical protein
MGLYLGLFKIVASAINWPIFQITLLNDVPLGFGAM